MESSVKTQMNLTTLRTKYKHEILDIARLCHAENIRIFGSVARKNSRRSRTAMTVKSPLLYIEHILKRVK